MAATPTPEGIEDHHIRPQVGGAWKRLPLGLIGLGLILAMSFGGVFGAERPARGAGSIASVAVDAPGRIRNGEFYEMRVTVEVHEAVDDLVVRVGEDVWRDVTVNTLIPAATEERHEEGAFAFAFGPMAPGTRFVMKIDCQVNPDHTPSANRGPIAVADGDGAPLATADYSLEVLP
jgi:hypothetical protein